MNPPGIIKKCEADVFTANLKLKPEEKMERFKTDANKFNTIKHGQEEMMQSIISIDGLGTLEDGGTKLMPSDGDGDEGYIIGSGDNVDANTSNVSNQHRIDANELSVSKNGGTGSMQLVLGDANNRLMQLVLGDADNSFVDGYGNNDGGRFVSNNLDLSDSSKVEDGRDESMQSIIDINELGTSEEGGTRTIQLVLRGEKGGGFTFSDIDSDLSDRFKIGATGLCASDDGRTGSMHLIS